MSYIDYKFGFVIGEIRDAAYVAERDQTHGYILRTLADTFRYQIDHGERL